MRICLLTDSPDPLVVPPAPDDFPCDPRPYLPEAEWTWAMLNKATAVKEVIELSRQGFDLFFNLCDSAWDEPRPGIEVVQTLERLGVPFTGADSGFFEPSRDAMKRVCRAWGVDVPAHVLADDEADVARAADLLRFPLIVKHPNSYSSVGLTRDSRVVTREGLFREARVMMEQYGATLIEEFIDGREFTVLVAENPEDPDAPITYAPVEFRFPEGETFKHYDLKWVAYHGMHAVPCEDEVLAERLREASARLFRGLDGAGYGRTDIRVDAEGRIVVLEINPNCGMYYPESDPGSADLILMNDPAGHAGFTRQVVRAALGRAARRRRSWEVRADREGNYGLFATRRIVEGEVVIAFEEEAHHLVSRAHVERSWGEPHRGWFERYAWPLTDEVWVTWGRDPDSWKPVNHACDPSAWLDGLDLVARRDIRPGEEITTDYATYYNERMPAFECTCGAACCRGVIRGDDYLQEFVERYGDHVSDYVRSRRRERAVVAPRRRRVAG